LPFTIKWPVNETDIEPFSSFIDFDSMKTHSLGSARRFIIVFTALAVLLLSLLVCSEGRTFEETEAYFERSVNFNNHKAKDLLEGPGWTVYSDRDQHTRTKDLPYYVTYQLSWAFESVNCVGWNPTLLITCAGEGKPVLISKGSMVSNTPDCGSTESSIVCIMPIEENTSLSSTLKATDIMTFECRGKQESDLLAGVGLRTQDLTCNGSNHNQSAKQGLKMDVVWQNNVAYSFQCRTIDSVLTTFDDKGHCMSMVRPETCQSGDSGSPCLVSLPKRYLTQIDDFFQKNPGAISQSVSVAPAAQEIWASDSTPSPPTNARFVTSS